MNSTITKKSGMTKAILAAGLIAGSLDAAAASIQFYINTGKGPARVFRYIASAVFKERTKTGDINTWAAWGLLFHFLIAMIFTAVFFIFYRQIRSVFRNKYVAGIIYGIFAWCVMNLVVVPLAFQRGISLQFKGAAIAMGILIIAIGLPISLLADRYYSKKR